ncbi:unnamed protein product [Cylindrotheca closterium]|uniref:MULE transposase domain-containing protein n=1 Tax=Cylindrotheca closterium TaxID=2856 RepID=A0AAD2G7F9_9STRA|nr:unnamed protein product [Cylindrotheca closterium]
MAMFLGPWFQGIRAKVLSHFSQSRPNEKATPTKDKMRKPTPLQIVSPPPMGPGGLAAMRQAVHAAAAPMIKQQLCRFTSTLTVTDQLTRTEFIHNQREAIEAKAIKAVCSRFVRAKAMPGGIGDTTKNASRAICPQMTGDTMKNATEAICPQKTLGLKTPATTKPPPRGLYSISNVSIEEKEKNVFARSVEVEAGLKTIAPMHQLVTEAEEHMKTLQHTILLSGNRVMLGAAWMDENNYRQFLCYPEVLFIDATHKTNNEGRPLLLICGRDSAGKAFVVIHVFMPNESQAFYRWIFLQALPAMLGVGNLKRVHLILTDGDASEYNAVDQSIFRYVKNAIRGRCGHHLIEKTFLKHGPKDNEVKNQSNGQAILLEIRRWVRSWIDRTSCHSKKAYELSKALLLQELQTNFVLRPIPNDQNSMYEIRRILSALQPFYTSIQKLIHQINCGQMAR